MKTANEVFLLDARPVPNEVLERYFITYKDMVYRRALRFLPPSDADDVLQDVFIKLVHNAYKLKSDLHVKYWLIRVTTNACYDRLSNRRNREVSYDDLLLKNGPDADETPGAAEDSLDFEIEDDRIAALPAALKRLKEDQRSILHQFYYRQLSVRKIAQALGISEGAAKVRLCRARDALRKRIEEVSAHENA